MLALLDEDSDCEMAGKVDDTSHQKSMKWRMKKTLMKMSLKKPRLKLILREHLKYICVHISDDADDDNIPLKERQKKSYQRVKTARKWEKTSAPMYFSTVVPPDWLFIEEIKVQHAGKTPLIVKYSVKYHILLKRMLLKKIDTTLSVMQWMLEKFSVFVFYYIIIKRT